MRVVWQRVTEAAVAIDGVEVARIGRGALILACVALTDGREVAIEAARKIAGLRLFDDVAGKMNLDLATVGGEVLVVSQFTLLADVARGRRPSFTASAGRTQAEPLLDIFVSELRSLRLPVSTGRFGAEMRVHLVNDGPVTLVLDFGADASAQG
ncbi:MAG: D-aminoacyl-tRNA deacylase [Thermoanaerobaculia bacterium]